MAAGSIVWNLLMNTASFQTDAKKATGSLKEVKKEAGELKEKLEKLAGALGIAVTFHEIYEQVREAANQMDEFSKTAKKVGTSTENFSKLAYAASLSDVSTEDLAASMAKLAKSMAEGNPALDAMGVKTKDASGNLRDTSAVLADAAEKFAGYKDSANKTNLAIQAFGKSGANLIPLLNSGADGLKQMGDEAAQFGIVVSTEAGAAAEEFNDQLTRFSAVIKGEMMQATSELLPTMKQIADAFVDGAKGAQSAASATDVLKTVMKLTASAGVVATYVFEGFGKLLAGVANASRLLFSSDTDARGFTQRFKAATDSWTMVFKDIGIDAKSTKARLKAFWADVPDDAKKAAEETKKAQKDAPLFDPNALAKAEAARKAAQAKALAEEKKYQEELVKLAKEGQQMQSDFSPEMKRTEQQAKIQVLYVVGAIDDKTYKAALAKTEADYQATLQGEQDALRDGLRTEEQDINASYERRRTAILALTTVTEQDRQAALADLQEKRDKDLANAQYNRYKDLMTAEETATHDYLQRKQALYDDDTLTTEARNQYLLKLSNDYHKTMQDLDQADQDKRDALAKAQIDLMTQGFSGMADLAKAFAGEQSGTYQALFAASKAFAIADITIKQSQAIAKAWGENNYWTAIGLTVGLAAQFAGLLSSANGTSFGGTRADGGGVQAGRSYLVGERGPERFTPQTPGTITSNADLQPKATTINVKNVNAYDTAHVSDYMQGSDGEKVIVNAVRRNRKSLGIT